MHRNNENPENVTELERLLRSKLRGAAQPGTQKKTAAKSVRLFGTRRVKISDFPRLVFVLVNLFARAVLLAIQLSLFALGQMTTMLGFINAFALRDIRVMLAIVGSLLAAHRAIFQALIDAGLLIVQTLVDLVYALVVRNFLRHG